MDQFQQNQERQFVPQKQQFNPQRHFNPNPENVTDVELLEFLVGFNNHHQQHGSSNSSCFNGSFGSSCDSQYERKGEEERWEHGEVRDDLAGRRDSTDCQVCNKSIHENSIKNYHYNSLLLWSITTWLILRKKTMTFSH